MPPEDVTSPTTTTPSPTPTPTETTTGETTLLNRSPEGDAGHTPTTPPAPAPGAPEAYADFTAPSGRELDADAITAIKPLFKELNLTQAQAQRLVDAYNENAGKAFDKLYSGMRETRAGWARETQTYLDSVGGAASAKAEIGKALNAVFAHPDGTPNATAIAEFRSAMDMTGAGDNPAFVKAFYRMAKTFNEGKPVTGAGPSPEGQRPPGGRPSAAAAMYPKLAGTETA